MSLDSLTQTEEATAMTKSHILSEWEREQSPGKTRSKPLLLYPP